MKNEYKWLARLLWLIVVVFFAIAFGLFWIVFLTLPVRA